MTHYFTLFVVAVGLWYLLFVRFSRHQRIKSGSLIYWCGLYLYDPARSMLLKVAVAIVNVVVIYALVLAASWMRSL